MENSAHELWKTVLGAIETEISRANYLTLFKNTTLLSLEGDRATIAAPSNMIIDLIQKRFNQLIQETLNKHTGRAIEILFVPRGIEIKTPSSAGPLFIEEGKSIGHLPRVRSDYTFDTLAVSSSNQLAFISASTVAKNLGNSYNPLFIYGPTGVGKTHLMQAIANEVYQKSPSIKIVYLTSEEFTNEVVEAIRNNQTHTMKRKFRTAGLMIIDDVQFIAGKDKVQEELFHTFNILIDNGSQIVLSSDRPPNEIQKLEKRLSSRFAGGLTVDIETPDFELRAAILLIKAKKYGVTLSIDIAKEIAQRSQDARSLEGVLLRIFTEAQTKGVTIDLPLVEKILSGREEGKRTAHPDDVIKKVCEFYDLKPTQIKGPKRDASLVRARQAAMYILKRELNLTFVEIGNLMGGRDHTTVMHGVEKVENILKEKVENHEEILRISRTIRE